MAPGMVQGKNEYPAEDFDPSDPNCLSPKLHVTDYVNDPTFESKETIPFISTMALSKLLIRAVLLGDNDLLQEIIQDKSNIYSFCVPRSVDVDRDALSYALQTENVAAVKILMDSKRAEKLGPRTKWLIEEESTSKGLQTLTLTMGQVGKEGNAALLKDKYSYESCPTAHAYLPSNYIQAALEYGI